MSSAKNPDRRRSDILDVAQRLVYAHGYEQMTIQDILDELKISKGAFYHYFGSKQQLLEALIERMLDDAEQAVRPIAQDPGLPALEKLQRYFATAVRWKTERKDYLLAMLRIWYADENAIVREKMRATSVKRIAPLLEAIVQQGIQEGVLTTSHAGQIGEVVLSLMMGLGDAYAEALLANEHGSTDLRSIERTANAYTRALERVLGAPAGSLVLVDAEVLSEWFLASAPTAPAAGRASQSIGAAGSAVR